jgi:hypothetical protein
LGIICVAADRGLSHVPEFEWAKPWSRNFCAINNLDQALVAHRIIGTRLNLKLAPTDAVGVAHQARQLSLPGMRYSLELISHLAEGQHFGVETVGPSLVQ